MEGRERRVIVVTGGAGGMGLACARRLGGRGVLLIADVDAERLERAAGQLAAEGMRVKTQVCDVTDIESVRGLAGTAASLGGLGALVHTAGISGSMESWRRVVTVNLVGTALFLDAFLPLATAGVAAVCIASNSGYLWRGDPSVKEILDDPLQPELPTRLEPFIATAPDPGAAAYTLSKVGVIRLCERLAPDWGRLGARIVSVSPGIIDTPLAQLEFEHQPMMKRMVEYGPIPRWGTPEEVAAAVDFLSSAEASFATGCDFRMDGGVVAAMAFGKLG
jgi:NAD(P)-dependent dehydrogenase (short-subunit alcohol dehydrogenase family)